MQMTMQNWRNLRWNFLEQHCNRYQHGLPWNLSPTAVLRYVTTIRLRVRSPVDDGQLRRMNHKYFPNLHWRNSTKLILILAEPIGKSDTIEPIRRWKANSRNGDDSTKFWILSWIIFEDETGWWTIRNNWNKRWCRCKRKRFMTDQFHSWMIMIFNSRMNSNRRNVNINYKS